MKTLSKKIAECIEYYAKDPKKRRNIDGEKCKYSGKTTGKQTKGCMVGYFLTPAQRLKADSREISGASGLIAVDDLYLTMEVPRIVSKNVGLMTDLQNLHDAEGYWDEKGLSVFGKNRVKDIIQDYSLDFQDFKGLLEREEVG